MALFYKYVICKNDEYNQEIMKLKQAQQIRRVVTKHFEREGESERGIIITQLDINNPMKISFANKELSRITKFDHKECHGLIVNQIMPYVIASNHHLFLQKFMKTGKTRIINQKSFNYVKQKSGYIIPAFLYISFDSLNLENIIVMIEPIYDNYFIGDREVHKQAGLIITDKDLQVYEVNEYAKSLCNLSNTFIQNFKHTNTRQPLLDDFFLCENIAADIVTLIQNQTAFEFDVRCIISEDQVNRRFITIDEVNSPRKYKNQDTTHLFNMRVYPVSFCKNLVEMKVISFMRPKNQ